MFHIYYISMSLTTCLVVFTIVGRTFSASCDIFDLEKSAKQARDSMARIVSGVDASHTIPWQVKLVMTLTDFGKRSKFDIDDSDEDRLGEIQTATSCSGTIIDDWNILTARHCVEKESKSMTLTKITVESGRYLFHRPRSVPPPKGWNDTDHEIRHEQLTIPLDNDREIVKRHDSYDLALLKLPIRLNLSQSQGDGRAFPACLPSGNMTVDKVNETNCFAFGWGKLCGHGNLSPTALQMARMYILANKTCKNSDKQGMLCASGNETTGVPSTCFGDSGTGLVCRLKKKRKTFVLMGVLSGSIGDVPGLCGESTQHSQFVRVSAFISWIEQNKKTGPWRKRMEPIEIEDIDFFQPVNKEQEKEKAEMKRKEDERIQQEVKKREEKQRQERLREERRRRTTSQPLIDDEDDDYEKEPKQKKQS